VRKGKKTVLLLLTIACLTFLAGFAVKTVELLNENPPLIDLSLAIEEAKFGQSGNESHLEGDDPDHSQEEAGEGRTITITVRGEGVWLEEHRFFSLDSLKTRIEKNYRSGDVIRLVDDYAEAHYYREILAIIEQLNKDGGYPYEAD